MERSEPTLIPEWLRCSGSASGGGNSAHHFASHPGVLSSANSSRNKCSRSTSDKDYNRSTFLERSSSSNFRRSTGSNGSPKHPYSSFTRSHRDKIREKEKERSFGDFWDHESSDPLSSILISRGEKDTLRRSRSLVYRKPGEAYPQRAVTSSNGGNHTHNITNGVLSRGAVTGSIQKTSFEKDFPSLGTGEKQGMQDVGRVSSPGLSSAVQCLPIGNTGLIGGEGWTSALAEVPTIIGSNSMGPTSVQQSVPVTPATPMAGLNMAEALSQAPSRARTAPQLPDKTQRLEELALKQSRQLIPMTPSAPKGLVSSSDKLKPKTVARTSEPAVAAKVVQQQPSSSHVASHSLRGGQVKPDVQRSSQAGKFHVLKPLRENGVPSVANDTSSPTNNGSKLGSNQLVPAPAPAPAPVAPSAPLKSPRSSKVSAVEQKLAALAFNSASMVEKKHSLAQAQSRSDFFNLMRKKGSRNTSVGVQNSGATISDPSMEKSGEVVKEESAPASPSVADGSSGIASNGDVHEQEKGLCLNGSLYPDEEEAAFLRSLGWEENGEEDDGLTEEEINAFYEEYMKLRPTLKLCKGVQTKLPMLAESHTTGSSRASSELSLSESEIEA